MRSPLQPRKLKFRVSFSLLFATHAALHVTRSGMCSEVTRDEHEFYEIADPACMWGSASRANLAQLRTK